MSTLHYGNPPTEALCETSDGPITSIRAAVTCKECRDCLVGIDEYRAEDRYENSLDALAAARSALETVQYLNGANLSATPAYKAVQHLKQHLVDADRERREAAHALSSLKKGKQQ